MPGFQRAGSLDLFRSRIDAQHGQRKARSKACERKQQEKRWHRSLIADIVRQRVAIATLARRLELAQRHCIQS